MLTFAQIEARRIRYETMRRLVAYLARNGSTKDIGARVVQLNFILNRDDEARQNDVAKTLGVSKQRVSAAIDRLREEIECLQGETEHS